MSLEDVSLVANEKIKLCPKKMKLYRKSLGLSQEALCDALYEKQVGVSLSTVKRAELGQRINLMQSMGSPISQPL